MSEQQPDGEQAPINAPIRAAAVPVVEFVRGDKLASAYRHLSAATPHQPYKIGVVLEQLPPGKTTNQAHYHLREEEHVYILSGSLTVRLGQRRHVMQAGDYVRFPAGVADEHALFNHTVEPCTYLLIGDRDPNDVCFYPDTGKVGVTAAGKVFSAKELGYWDGVD